MRWALGATVALLAAAAIGVMLLRPPAGAGGSGVVVAVHRGFTCGRTHLERVDPTTLERRGGRILRLSGYFSEPVPSPDRKAVALGGVSGTIVVADVRSMRRLASIRIGGRYESTGVVAWPSGGRLVAESLLADAHRIGTHRLVVVDPKRRRVIREARFDEWWTQGRGRTDQGRVAVLIVSSVHLGHPRLAVVGGDGRIRLVTLNGLSAGLGRTRRAELGRFPGLAIDPGTERAFVVNEGEPVAIVDLRTLEIHYRDLPGLAAPPRGLAGPPRDTGTANPRRGPMRMAMWLGDDRVAISGSDSYTGPVGRRLGDSEAPAGLQILDTRTWRVRTLDSRPSSFEWLSGRLVASARAWDPRARRVRGDALVAFDPTGRLVYRVQGKRYWQSFAGRIFWTTDRHVSWACSMPATDTGSVGFQTNASSP